MIRNAEIKQSNFACLTEAVTRICTHTLVTYEVKWSGPAQQ